MPEEQKVTLPSPEEITKAFQSHVDKLIPIITANEVKLATRKDLSIKELMETYEQQRVLEGAVQMCITLEKRFNPNKIVTVR